MVQGDGHYLAMAEVEVDKVRTGEVEIDGVPDLRLVGWPCLWGAGRRWAVRIRWAVSRTWRSCSRCSTSCRLCTVDGACPLVPAASSTWRDLGTASGCRGPGGV